MAILRSAAPVALALVAVVAGVKDPIHLGDAQRGQVVEDFAGAEIDQDRARTVADDINLARVLEDEEVVAKFAGRA